jgi:hypothetical protein
MHQGLEGGKHRVREHGAPCKVARQRCLQGLEVDAITKTVKQSLLQLPTSFEPLPKICGVDVTLETEANRRPLVGLNDDVRFGESLGMGLDGQQLAHVQRLGEQGKLTAVRRDEILAEDRGSRRS